MNMSSSRFWLAGIIALTFHVIFLFWPLPVVTIKAPVSRCPQKIIVNLSHRKSGSRTIPDSSEAKQKTEKQKEIAAPQNPHHPQPSPAMKPVTHVTEVSKVSEQKAAIAPIMPKAVPEVQPVREEIKSPESTTVEQHLQTKNITPVAQQAMPLYQVNPPPVYPRLARRRGLQGTVLLAARIDVTGHVQELEIVTSSGHKILDKAAVKAVWHWLFRPGTIGTHPQEMWVNVPVRFQLK
jgi:protein TonB